jgi:hypothetical protein
VLVLDASAITALLDSHPQIYDIWLAADAEQTGVAIPVGVMFDVAAARRVTAGQWAPLLWSPTIQVMELTDTIAREIGAWSGPLGVRHALWESRALGAPILTFDGRPYGPDADLISL